MNPSRLLRSAALLAVVSTLAALATPSVLAAQQRHGDVNGDGVVSALDAQAILTAVVGLPLPPGYVSANGDSNCDNTSVALDAQIVLSYVIGLDVTPYCVGAVFGPGGVTITLLAGTAAVPDTSLLINRGVWLRATLKNAGGFDIQRPVAWTTSTPDLVTLDTARSDSVFVKAGGTAGTASVTASSDGVTKAMPIKLVTSFAGIVIQPQRGDTIEQLNGTRTFTVRDRDSVGTISGFPTAFWTTGNTSIATVPSAATNSGVVTAVSTGTTWVYATSSTNPAARDSVPLTVALPAVNSCVAGTGTLHSNTTYTTPQTWAAATNPHHVSGTLTFNSGSRLSIEPGVLVCMGSGAYMYFNDGSRITAVGTASSPITFTTVSPSDLWSQIQLGNNTGARNDTSTFRNVLMEHAYNGVIGYNDHVVTMDSVRIRDFGYYALQLYALGSRVSRSTIDTSRTGYNGTGAYLGSVTFEESTVRLGGSTGSGLFLYDSAIVRQVTIVGGGTGIDAAGGTSSARLNDVTISNAGNFGVELPNYYNGIQPTSANVQITGSRVGFSGDINSLAILFPDTTAQAALLAANVTDSIYLTGGYLKQRSLTLLPSAKWRVNGELIVDTLARLTLLPATRIEFEYTGIRVRNSGRMDARGSAAAPVVLAPRAGAQFYGLVFENAPLPGGLLPAPVDTSTLLNVRVDSAGGYCGQLSCASISSFDRHVLLVDSTIVRKSVSYAGGISLVAPGSRISRSRIDTTGAPTASYAALTLGARTRAENVSVLRSGADGVSVQGDSVRLTGLVVRNSLGVGLQAVSGKVVGDSGGVTVTGNASPFRGYIDSFAALARDTVAQLQLLGNTSDTVVIWGGSGRPFRGRVATGALDTLRAMRSLPWRVEDVVYIDSLARFIPQPGTRLTFNNGGFYFARGGRLIARGTPTDSIHFTRWGTGAFYGLTFKNPYLPGGAVPPPAPYDTSVLVRARLSDINSYQCGPIACGALTTEDRHVLTVDSVRIRQSVGSAVVLNAPGSRVSRTIIDTTGSPTSSWAAIVLGNSTLAESTTVRRSGQTGMYIVGSTAQVRQLEVLNSVSYGAHLSGSATSMDSLIVTGAAGSAGIYIDQANLAIGRFIVSGSAGNGVSVAASGVQLTNCDVVGSLAHGIATTSNYTGVTISNCNIESNAVRGVNNFNPLTATYLITATNNWWGANFGGAAPPQDSVNGPSANVDASSSRTTKRVP